MSGDSLKSIAGGIVGAFIGSYFGYPGLGFTIGSALFASSQEIITGQTDPGDLNFEISSYGKFQPIGYGAHRVVMPPSIWSDDFVAIRHEEEVGGGKGGGSEQTNVYYTYTRSFAVYLRSCVDGTPINGIGRIWNLQTGKVIYDRRSTASTATLIQSVSFAKSVRFYDGSLSQNPDPVIEAIEGASPAFRGHAYLVFEDFDHDRNKSPVPLAVEVFYGGTESGLRRIHYNQNGITLNVSDSFMWHDYNSGIVSGYADPNDLRPVYGDLDKIYKYRYDVDGNFLYSESDPIRSTDTLPACAPYPTGASYFPQGYFGGREIYFINGGIGWIAVTGEWCFMEVVPESGEIHIAISGDKQYMMEWHTGNGNYYIYDTSFAIVDSGSISTVLTTHTTNGGGSSRIPKTSAYSKAIGLLEHDDGVFYFWTTHDEVGDGSSTYHYVWQLDAGVTLIDSTTIDLLGDTTNGQSGIAHAGHAWYFHRNDMECISRISAITNSAVLLSDVVEDICDRVGFTDYDTSALSTQYVRYKIDKLTTARNWLAALSQIYNFRIRNSGGTLTFIDKGAASVDTIPATDLGMEVGENNLTPPIVTRRAEGIDLPRSVTIKYSDASADYNAGQQSYVMNNYEQGQNVVIETSAVLTGDEALALAQRACKEPHLQRIAWETTLGLKYIHLEAGDVVDLPNGTAWIQAIGETGDNILRVALVAESTSAYTGNGLPSASVTVPSVTQQLAGETRIEVLDIPYLSDDTSEPGFYIAVCGYLAGWDGCTVYQSSDGGENWSNILTIENACTMGYATTVLPDASPFHYDYDSTVTVRLFSGTLSTITETELLNLGNTCIIGNELLQFQTATDNGNGTYTLSGIMLRGRRGTENYTGTHAVNDRFVLLNNNVRWVRLSTDLIGTSRLFRAVSFGTFLVDADNESFTPASIPTKPYPPANPDGYLSGNDWVLSWYERARTGGEWRDYVGIVRDPYWNGYELEVMNGSTVVRTVTGLTSATYTYTSAMQVTDFGSNQSTVTFKVYQMSTVNGRGYANTFTVS